MHVHTPGLPQKHSCMHVTCSPRLHNLNVCVSEPWRLGARLCIYIHLARFCNVLVDSTKDVLVGWRGYEWGDVWLLYQFIDVGERALAHVSIQMVRRGSLLKRKLDNALYNSSLTTTCDVVSVVHVRQQGWEFLSCSSWQQSSIQRAYYGLVTRESPYTVHLHSVWKQLL